MRLLALYIVEEKFVDTPASIVVSWLTRVTNIHRFYCMEIINKLF